MHSRAAVLPRAHIDTLRSSCRAAGHAVRASIHSGDDGHEDEDVQVPRLQEFHWAGFRPSHISKEAAEEERARLNVLGVKARQGRPKPNRPRDGTAQRDPFTATWQVLGRLCHLMRMPLQVYVLVVVSFEDAAAALCASVFLFCFPCCACACDRRAARARACARVCMRARVCMCVGARRSLGVPHCPVAAAQAVAAEHASKMKEQQEPIRILIRALKDSTLLARQRLLLKARAADGPPRPPAPPLLALAAARLRVCTHAVFVLFV